jgi:branched-chain amino acid transport system ATP-binding protein
MSVSKVIAARDPARLEVDNLVMVRGTKAVVHGIELRVAPGRITALMGANGAGKTSTVLGIAGAIEPAFGEIWLAGQDLKGRDADEIRRLGVATVPEGHQVLRELTVRDNLAVAGGDLSGGQQQMVAIAQALVVTPKFLVIDELSFGLAPMIVARLVPVIRRIAAQGIGVLLIEQFTHLALSLADHVYVMSRGHVSYDGEPDKLIADPDILHRAYFPVSARESVGLA